MEVWAATTATRRLAALIERSTLISGTECAGDKDGRGKMRALLFGFPKRRIGRAEYFLRLFVGAILFLVLVMLDDRVGGWLAAKAVFIVGSLLLADWCWCTTGRLLDIGWHGWAAPLLVAIPLVS